MGLLIHRSIQFSASIQVRSFQKQSQMCRKILSQTFSGPIVILTLPLSISCSSFRNLTLVYLPYAISLQTFAYFTLYCGTTTEFCDFRLLETDSKFIIGFCIAWSVQPAISFEIHGANHRVHRRLLPCAGPYSPDMCQLSLVCSSVFAFFCSRFYGHWFRCFE